MSDPSLIARLGLTTPIIQAPMAGVSTPQMAAAVSNAGGLGSIGVGAAKPEVARAMIEQTHALTDRPFNVNVFVHADPVPDAARDRPWIEAVGPQFAAFAAEPPERPQAIYRSFAGDDAMLAVLVETSPAVVSFHFGLPDTARIWALKDAGCILFASATNLDEARLAEAAGVDAIVAQGWEAGGHRGVFDPDAPDARLATLDLVGQLVAHIDAPIIAAGGIMDGPGVAAALARGAVAAQMGTAFIACPESAADDAYRDALFSGAAGQTVMTRAISGRPARCLANRFTEWAVTIRTEPPPYPIAYDVGKALNTAAKAQGEGGFGAQWAGQGAPRARAMPAAELMAVLAKEVLDARA